MSDEEKPLPEDSPRLERIRAGIERMVMWGESKADAMHRLEVNGITGEEADAIYNAAFRERVATIHGHYRRIALIGLGSLVGAAAILAICYFVFEGINRLLFVIMGGLLVFGSWKTIVGMIGMFTAVGKEGSVADLE